MTAGRHVPDNQNVSLCLVHGSVQQLADIPTSNDHLGFGAQILLKFGDLPGGVAYDFRLPLWNDVGRKSKATPPGRSPNFSKIWAPKPR